MAIRFIPANDQHVPSIAGQQTADKPQMHNTDILLSFALKWICS
jgi:hypothetical protein